MTNEKQLFVDMAVHSLETDIADLERATSSEEQRALKAEEPRIIACVERLWDIAKSLQARAAA